MPFALAIFDLDGTLADSFPWFLRNVNDVADLFGFSRIGDEDIQSLRQAGSREILKALRVSLRKLPSIARHMRRLKAEHIEDIPCSGHRSDAAVALRWRLQPHACQFRQ
jgi:phosphoglycolate phosphatase